MEQTPEERKEFLKSLNEISVYTATVLHGDEVSKVRIKQFKKYFNKTYKMLHRISVLKGEVTNNSFKYGYGGKLLVRKVMLEMGLVEKQKVGRKKATYRLLFTPDEITMELVSRIIVEVYLIRNEVEPI
ncbi:MAG: hypothetical protein QNK23_14145 [Crocinitomicaceae bacterium]|nr:hypothetical protein [Crocinitomicaceae bacterium]